MQISCGLIFGLGVVVRAGFGKEPVGRYNGFMFLGPVGSRVVVLSSGTIATWELRSSASLGYGYHDFDAMYFLLFPYAYFIGCRPLL